MTDWWPMDAPPKEPCGVLLCVPAAAHEHLIRGQDYEIEIGSWDGRCFREQGTNHEINERLDFNGGLYMPTHWTHLPAPPRLASRRPQNVRKSYHD